MAISSNNGKKITVEPLQVPIKVSWQGQLLAQSVNALRLLEEGLPDRYYIPRIDVRLEVLKKEEHSTYCPYKGSASEYWSAASDPGGNNIAWSYPDPIPAVEGISGKIAFYDESTDIVLG